MINHNITKLIKKVFLPILFISGVLSQTKHEPFADEKFGKVYYIETISEAPVIDGVLDEAIWSSILPITDFVQEEPDNMALPTENMEVYFGYDDRNLYVGAKLYDSNPAEIARQLAPRDDWYGAFDEQADWFSIDLDSRHDHQTAFSFAVNASGVMSDEMIYNDEDYDTDWNAIWDAEAKITDFGWVVEMGIPFSMLPFNKGDELTWGLNITRFIQRKYETITWVAFPLEIEGIASKFGHLSGLKGIFPPAKFEFSPYSLGGITKYSNIHLTDYEVPNSWNINYENDLLANLGVDMLYRINTNSNLTITLNPDFGQVESDPADINLTAFETYFQEKRSFFLKDSDIFETPIEVFYSRRIGEKAWGAGMEIFRDSSRINPDNPESQMVMEEYTLYTDIPVIIKSAAKLTGKTESGLSYGLLGAVTVLQDSSSWSQQMIKGKNRMYLISRLKQDLFAGNSFIGMIGTYNPVDSAHTLSFDGITNLFDNQIGIDGQIVLSSSNKKGIYGSITYSPLGYFSSWIDIHGYEKGLNLNQLGYLWRDDYSQIKLGLKFQNPESWGITRNSAIILEADQEENSQSVDLGRTIELNYDVQFTNFWGIGGGFYKILEHFDDRKIIHDYDNNMYGSPIYIPQVTGSHFHLSSDKHKKLSGTVSWTWASNLRKDTELGRYLELIYKPNSYLKFSTSYDRYLLDKQFRWLESFIEWNEESQAFDDTHHVFSDLERKLEVLTFRATGNLNRKLSLQTYLEIYSNYDFFDKNSYSEYKTEEDTYDFTSDYILGNGEWEGMPVYTTNKDSLDYSYVDPNLYLGLYPHYTSFIFNGILKWHYTHGSNLYIVYTARKSVNGEIGSNLGDFFRFNDKKHWVEVLRDQTFMIKIDYWFEK